MYISYHKWKKKTSRDVLRAMLELTRPEGVLPCYGLKKKFTVPYRHGLSCLPCLEGPTQSGTKHERAVPCQHSPTQVPPLV